MNQPSGRFRAHVVLTAPNARPRYRQSLDTAIESFRKALELDEATLRPVDGSAKGSAITQTATPPGTRPGSETLTLRRTKSGAVVLYRKWP